MKEVKSILKLKDEDINTLKVNYKKEKEDIDFKNMLIKYHITDQIGMKYTSSLKEAQEEICNCKSCRGLSSCKNKIKGFCYSPIVKDNNIDFSYVSCRYENDYIKKTEYQKYVTLFDIPKELKNASLKDVYTDDKSRVPVIKYIKDFVHNYLEDKEQKGLYLSGNFGSGKTYLISALFNELAKRKVQSTIIYFPEFLRKLKSSFNENSYEDRFEFIKNVDLLLIDDIGAENLTPWGRDEVLSVILQHRMDEKLPTFFTSNLTLEELEQHLSFTSSGIDKVKARRIIERIKQLTVSIELVGKNRRN